MSYNENKLLKQLDKLFDEEKYAEITEEIRKIPRDEWSLELRFRLVSALNNMKALNEALAELHEIEPLCTDPADKARFWYNTGYVHYMNECEMVASHCFKTALEIDPEDTNGLDLKGIIEECDGFISRDLMELKGLGRAAVEAIHTFCGQVAEKDRKELGEPEFTMYLGYIPGIRKVTGVDKPLLFDDVEAKYSDEEKPIVRDFLKRFFGISDLESFRKFYFEDMHYNLYGLGSDVMAYLDGKPKFPISELNQTGKEMFEDCAEYLNAIRECVTQNTFSGWDIAEKIGIARHCYACDVLAPEDYIGCMKALMEYAKENFASFEEFMISYIMGCGFYMFLTGNCSIKQATGFMNMIMPMLLQSPLNTIKWA